MDPNIVLAKCITLLYRESQLENSPENSSDLVRNTVDKIYINDTNLGVGSRRAISMGLKDLVLDMCRNKPPHVYVLDELLQQVRLLTNGDENIYQAIAEAVKQELQGPVLKRTITNLKKNINTFFRQEKTSDLLRKASREYAFDRKKMIDPADYINNLVLELQILSNAEALKENPVVKSVDFSDDASITMVFNDVAASNNADLPFLTGSRELNMALQGGPRPGDTVVIGALQHNYKTGFSLSLFADCVVENKPKCKDPAKKPLAYRITAEDPIRNNAQFLYQKFMFEETGEVIDIGQVGVDEMVAYIKKKMGQNGYQVIMDEINPSDWTYKTIINQLISLESKGYVVEIFCIDYLSKISTEGCNHGAQGDDMLDLFTKLRNYCAANGILFITPHQLSTDAKRLLQTVPAEGFLNQIKGGGFFEKTKGLDRIYDIGILLHKVESGDRSFLNVVVDKHRFPTVVDSSLKSFFLPFPKCGMPIPNNLHFDNYKIHRKLPKSFAVPVEKNVDQFVF